MQQRDPLGPILFCLTVHSVVKKLTSELRVFYMDDGILGGNLDIILQDLHTVERLARDLGLQLNRTKSEIIYKDPIIVEAMIQAAPGLKVVNSDDAFLLGSPIGSLKSIEDAIGGKTEALQTLSKRLPYLHSHDAFCLLKHAFAIPKLCTFFVALLVFYLQLV